MNDEITTEKIVSIALAPLIKEVRSRVFMPDYRDSASDADVLGIIISKYFRWDGVQILETAASALEDANFSGENTKLLEMIEELQK